MSDAESAPASSAGMTHRVWGEEPLWEVCDPDDDTVFEIGVRSLGRVYAARSELFDAVCEIKERLRPRG
ncbi:MAG TPA: hypothetical protein VFV55_11115 [Usitatibacteraceae bacterium]|nr:hypothetical protein [Usitatibacteraceae bacterium]